MDRQPSDDTATQRIWELRWAGWPAPAIATELGLPLQTVNAALAQLRHTGAGLPARSTQKKKQILSLYRQGWTADEIATDLGIPVTGVENLLQQIHELETPPDTKENSNAVA